MDLDRCIRTCIHHYSIIQSIFIALKELRFSTTVGYNHHLYGLQINYEMVYYKNI